jgi:hypothetical protein
MTHLQSPVRALKKYPVTIRDGFVWVDVSGEGSGGNAEVDHE